MGNVSQMHRTQCERSRVCPPAAQHGLTSGPLAEKRGPGNSRPHWSQVFLDKTGLSGPGRLCFLRGPFLFLFLHWPEFLQWLHSLEWAESRTRKAQGLFICSFYWEKGMVFNRKKQIGKKNQVTGTASIFGNLSAIPSSVFCFFSLHLLKDAR